MAKYRDLEDDSTNTSKPETPVEENPPVMEVERVAPHTTSHFGLSADEPDDDPENWDVMDLASFLELAIAATLCLEVLHKAGLIHRELRPNAFHVNSHSGVVRFAHFGNRSVSLERFGGPSALVIESGELPEHMQRKVKEAMCYMAPEQTGTAETVTEDHRTDLYSLGVLFWTMLVGHGTLPFEGGAMELLQSIVQKKPPAVNEIRPDVPQVLGGIIEKVCIDHVSVSVAQSDHILSLIAARQESRPTVQLGCWLEERSCGVPEEADLIMRDDRRLVRPDPLLRNRSTRYVSRADDTDNSGECRYAYVTLLSLKHSQFGRDRELEIIRNVIRNATAAHSTARTLTWTQHHSVGSMSTQRISQIIGMHHTGASSQSSIVLGGGSVIGGSSIDSEPALSQVGNPTDRIDPSSADPMSSASTLASSSKLGLVIEERQLSEEATDVAGPLPGTMAPPSEITVRANDPTRRGSAYVSHSPASSIHSPIIPTMTGLTGFSIGSHTPTPSAASLLSIPTGRSRMAKAHAVVVCGAAGVGKSSLILSNQAGWRSHGLWGYAKMVKGESSPFTGLVRPAHQIEKRRPAYNHLSSYHVYHRCYAS